MNFSQPCAKVWIVVIGLSLCCAASSGCRKRKPSEKDSQLSNSAPIKIIYPSTPNSFVKLVKKVENAVVHLSATAPVQNGPLDWYLAGETDLGDLEAQMQRSLGTGFIIDQKGHCLTSAHLVKQRKALKATLYDGAVVDATLVGLDETNNVALLKLTSSPQIRINWLRLGDSQELQIGEWVVAIGNPFGLGVNLAKGVVSAQPIRELPPGHRSPLSLIQTDLSVNPSNSGGPLLNMAGEVVGICNALSINQHDFGYAVPINLVKQMLPILKKTGKVSRVFVGIYVDAVPKEKAKSAELKGTEGALVTAVVPGGPAEQAGLRADDIILSYDHQRVLHHTDLPWLAASAGVNRLIQLKVFRDGKILHFSLKTEPMPE